MALKKPATTENTTPAFEAEDEAVLADQKSETEPTVTAKAKVEATTAIAKAKTTAVASGGTPFRAGLTHLEQQLDLETVRALGVGTLPKLVADRAGFEMGGGKDKKEFGDYVDFQIVSYNNRWLYTSGVDGDEGKDLLRTSYDDGETLEGHPESGNEYLRYLKDEGYPKADKRQYIDLWGFVVASDKLGAVDEDEREMIQLQLSPSSVKQFKAYQVQAGIRAATTGKQPTDFVRATIEKKEFNGNKYASIKFVPVPA